MRELDSLDVQKNNSISDRAALFLVINYPRNRAKLVACAMGISVPMAKLLSIGRGWTVARLDQATHLWPSFQAFVWPSPQTFDDRLDRLLKEIATVRDEINLLKQKLDGS